MDGEYSYWKSQQNQKLFEFGEGKAIVFCELV